MSIIKRAKDNYFIINGKPSSDFDMVVSGDNTFDAPARDEERFAVPGRNGELVIDRGRWQNIDVTYNDCVIESGFGEKFGSFRKHISNLRGYQRLEDTFHPDEYRLADFSQGVQVKKLGTRYNSGVFDLTFNCKPQRFLKSGEEAIVLIPPLTTGGFSTPWMSGPAMYGLIVKVLMMPENSSIALSVEYDHNGTTATVSLGTATSAGDEFMLDLDLPVDDDWRIVATLGNISADDVLFQVVGRFNINDKTIYETALWGRSIDIFNPTGYECRPYIEVDGDIFAIQRVTNYDADGNETEFWTINCNDYSSLTTNAIVDCENEYFYYVNTSGQKKNITGYMEIEHYDADSNDRIPSFPKLGSGKTNIYSYITYAGYHDVFIRIYPHWFTI